jgi:hypothetical protein
LASSGRACRDYHDRYRAESENLLDGAPEKRRGDASPSAAAHDEEVMVPACLPAKCESRFPTKKHETLFSRFPDHPRETVAIVVRDGLSEVPRAFFQQITAVLVDGGANVGIRPDMGHCQRAS